MGNLKDITGNRYGKLTVIAFVEYNKWRCSMWKCRCDCGTETIVNGGNLRSGHSKSCGCDSGEKHGGRNDKLYGVWNTMIQRCHNSNSDGYIYYGGRGIVVCDQWRNSPSIFFKWAFENGYLDGLCIDRINNEGPYSPNNCQWITPAENCMPGKRRIPRNNKTGFVGVHIDKRTGRYIADLTYKGIRHSKYSFETPEEAYEERINMEIKHIGRQVTFCNG